MLQSMTGYGKAALEEPYASLYVEVKTLNAKYADITLKMPSAWSAQEIPWRQTIASQLVRGKISVTLSITPQKSAKEEQMALNAPLVKAYYQQLLALNKELSEPDQPLLPLVLKRPDIWKKPDVNHPPSEKDVQAATQLLTTALAQCRQHRQAEGHTLALALRSYIAHIGEELTYVKQLAPSRTQAMKQHLQKALQELPAHTVDEGRLMQELLYYAEKWDITEEQVRLATHLQYFLKTLEKTENPGKKLGFIAQEMGREINTIGAKANHTGMQQHVMHMKEALEKIREQLHNCL